MEYALAQLFYDASLTSVTGSATSSMPARTAMSVLIGPGCTLNTWVSCSASCSRSDWVIEYAAAFDAQ